MEVLVGYDRIIFVDAHVYENVEALHCCPVSPDAASLIFTHHMTPSTLLAMQKAIYDVEPTGHLVSLRGYDFDFHRGLSADTETLVEPAVEWILQRLTEGVGQIEASR
jgi:Ni,Fe-hydrogenase maturation factor